MEGIDRELERRVWKRVREGTPEAELGWQQLARQELADAIELERLAGKFRGKVRGELLKVAGRERQHGRLLARRLGMSLPGERRDYTAAGSIMESLEAVADRLWKRAGLYGDRAVCAPEDSLLRQLAWEERRGYEALRVLLGQIKTEKIR